MNILERQAQAKNKRPTWSTVFSNPLFFIAAGFGSGLMPMMPGTWGTVVAIPIYLLMQNLSLLVYSSISLLIILFFIYCSHITAKAWGMHDHPVIVCDEIAGYLVTMIAAPPGWWWIIVGFLLFRFFDILKPWPIGWLDRHVHGGFGIVVDDLVAGVFSWIILQLIYMITKFF